MHIVDDWSGALAVIHEGMAASVVVDIEPGVAAWDTSAHELATGLDRVLSGLETAPSVQRLIFATNSRRVAEGSDRYEFVARARKPWRISAFHALPRPIFVVGDQVLTDGLLAFRLGATFVHHRATAMPIWPRLQARVGRIVAPLLFKVARGS